ncbi:MAG: hypothetical protein AB1458_04275 [Bacteroidota bacterium]
MKNLYIILAVIGLWSFTLADDSCGKQRWEIKTLSDKDAGKIRLKPKKTTIRKMRALKVKPTKDDTPRQPIEMKAVKLDCYIAEYKKEGDHDYHLIIFSGKDTMVAEIVDPDCPDAKKSQYNSTFRTVRDTFDVYKKQGKYKKHKWRITGIPFIDVKHNGTRPEGQAPNEVEIHPVMKMERLN